MNDEIDLYELMRALSRRWKLFILIFIVAVVVGTGYVMSKPMVYMSEGAVRIAQIGSIDAKAVVHTHYIDKAASLLSTLQSRDIPANYKASGKYTSVQIEQGFISKISGQKDSPILEFEALASTPDASQKILRDRLQALVSELNAQYSDITALFNARMKTLREKTNQIDRAIGELTGLSSQGEGGNSPFLVAERGALIDQEAQLQYRLDALHLALMPVYSKPARVLVAPTLGTARSRHGALIVAAAGFIGFVLGLFGVAIAEFLSTARTRGEHHA